MKQLLNKTLRSGLEKLKLLTCHFASLSLLFSPMTFAQDLSSVSGVLQGATATMQQVQAQQAQAQANAQMQAMMQSLSPQNQTGPSKYFPNCPVLKAVTDFPGGVCESAPQMGDNTGVQQMMTMKSLASGFENHISNLLAVNQNGQSIGLQCLQDGMIQVETQIEDRINNLQALINQVKKETQLFKEQNQKVIDGMDLLASELYGTGAKKQTPRDATNEFTSMCQNVIGSANFLEARSTGLVAVQAKTSLVNERASHASKNQDTHIAQVKSQINELDSRVRKNGIGPIVSRGPEGIQALMMSGGASTNFRAMNTVLQAQLVNLQEDFNRYNKDLAEVGYTDITLENLDHNFREKFSDVANNAASYFQKEAIDKCLGGTDNSLSHGLSTEQILNSLYAPSLSGSATTLESYKTELRAILDAQGTMSDKLASIKALDQRFNVGEILTNYKVTGGGSTSGTVYGLYKQQIDLCKSSIANKSTHDQESYATRIKRAEEAINNIMSLEKNYLSTIKSAMYERAVNCEGISNTADECTMNNLDGSGILSTSNDNYCVKNAVNCASQVMTCQSNLNTVIEKKQTEMKSYAATFNANVSGLVAKQEVLLNQVKAQVMADAEYLKNFFPGSTYAYPEDLFVELPVEVLHEDYQVALRGKGDLSQIESLPEKLQLLQDMLNGQKEKTGQVLEQYIANQKSGMERERKRWRSLADACESAQDAYNQAVSKQIADQTKQMQDKQEADAKAKAFCRRFDQLDHPAPNCGMVSRLSRDLDDVTGSITDEAIGAFSEMEYYCDEVQNIGEDDYTSSKPNSRSVASTMSPMERLLRDCDEEDQDWEKARDRLGRVTTEVDSAIDDLSRIVGNFDPEYFKKISVDTAKQTYCEAHGYAYKEEDKTCVESDEAQPNVCKYIDHVAWKDHGLATSTANRTALLEKYEEDSKNLKDSYLKDVMTGYNIKRQKVLKERILGDANDRLGEDGPGIDCLAQAEGQQNSGKGGMDDLGSSLSSLSQSILGIGGQRSQ